jgi:hypothetical protein
MDLQCLPIRVPKYVFQRLKVLLIVNTLIHPMTNIIYCMHLSGGLRSYTNAFIEQRFKHFEIGGDSLGCRRLKDAFLSCPFATALLLVDMTIISYHRTAPITALH